MKLPERFAPIAEQPISTEIKMADGVFVKTFVVHSAGTFIAQHSHAYPHVSVLVRGAIRVWRDNVFDAEYRAPVGITIQAGVKHMFEATEAGTTILCVHDIGKAEAVVIADEHHMPGVG